MIRPNTTTGRAAGREGSRLGPECGKDQGRGQAQSCRSTPAVGPRSMERRGQGFLRHQHRAFGTASRETMIRQPATTGGCVAPGLNARCATVSATNSGAPSSAALISTPAIPSPSLPDRPRRARSRSVASRSPRCGRGRWREEPELHERAWHWIAEIDPDLAFLQETRPPEWARERWES